MPPTPTPLTDADRELVETAEDVLCDHYHPNRHTTGAALRTASGAVYTGVSVKAGTNAADLHAEPVALARALMDGHREFDAVAAVQPARGMKDPEDGTRIVSACGVCREVLIAHAPDLWVIVPGGHSREQATPEEDESPGKRTVSDLLPD